MKHIILAVLAVLSLGAGVANAQSMAHNAPSQQNTTQNNWMAGGGG